MPTPEQVRQAIDSHFRRWNAGEREAWIANFADHVVFHDPVGSPPKSGRAAAQRSWDNSFTNGQAWTLDFLGNWKELVSDKDADGPDGASPDNTETRTHNDGNELTSLDPDGSGGGASGALTHDKAGNITSKYITYTDSNNYKKYSYVHDAWNRLVQALA